jgi:hypothetical protein
VGFESRRFSLAAMRSLTAEASVGINDLSPELTIFRRNQRSFYANRIAAAQKPRDQPI